MRVQPLGTPEPSEAQRAHFGVVLVVSVVVEHFIGRHQHLTRDGGTAVRFVGRVVRPVFASVFRDAVRVLLVHAQEVLAAQLFVAYVAHHAADVVAVLDGNAVHPLHVRLHEVLVAQFFVAYPAKAAQSRRSRGRGGDGGGGGGGHLVVLQLVVMVLVLRVTFALGQVSGHHHGRELIVFRGIGAAGRRRGTAAKVTRLDVRLEQRPRVERTSALVARVFGARCFSHREQLVHEVFVFVENVRPHRPVHVRVAYVTLGARGTRVQFLKKILHRHRVSSVRRGLGPPTAVAIVVALAVFDKVVITVVFVFVIVVTVSVGFHVSAFDVVARHQVHRNHAMSVVAAETGRLSTVRHALGARHAILVSKRRLLVVTVRRASGR